MKWESADGIPTETNGRKKEEMTDASGAFDVCLVSSFFSFSFFSFSFSFSPFSSSSSSSSSSFQGALKQSLRLSNGNHHGLLCGSLWILADSWGFFGNSLGGGGGSDRITRRFNRNSLGFFESCGIFVCDSIELLIFSDDSFGILRDSVGFFEGSVRNHSSPPPPPPSVSWFKLRLVALGGSMTPAGFFDSDAMLAAWPRDSSRIL